jgi:hypothetical protein
VSVFIDLGDLMDVDRRVWPLQVKSVILGKRLPTTTVATMEINTEKEHLDCENLVYERLQEMNEKIEQYQRQLDKKKSQLTGFTSTMEEAIDIYIQQHGIKPLKLKRDLKIALLKYDYDAEILERKYLQEKPNQYQVRDN